MIIKKNAGLQACSEGQVESGKRKLTRFAMMLIWLAAMMGLMDVQGATAKPWRGATRWKSREVTGCIMEQGPRKSGRMGEKLEHIP